VRRTWDADSVAQIQAGYLSGEYNVTWHFVICESELQHNSDEVEVTEAMGVFRNLSRERDVCEDRGCIFRRWSISDSHIARLAEYVFSHAMVRTLC